MTKNDFINGLRQALENELDSNKVRENIDYYTDYINNEIRSGRSESDVVAELGDPWAIAKTIITSEEAGYSSGSEYSYVSSDSDTDERQYQYGQSSQPKVRVFNVNSWWKSLLLILGIIGVLMIVFSIITGIISLIAPIAIPVIIVMLVLKLFKRR